MQRKRFPAGGIKYRVVEPTQIISDEVLRQLGGTFGFHNKSQFTEHTSLARLDWPALSMIFALDSELCSSIFVVFATLPNRVELVSPEIAKFTHINVFMASP